MGDRNSVVLLDSYPSPFGMRVRIALALKQVEYEHKFENLFNKSPLLTQMNPLHRKVPVLIHNGNPICESLIAVQYIDEVWPHKSPLLPSDPYRKAQSRFWADYADKKLSGAARKIWSTKGEEQETSKKEVIGTLQVLEAELGDKDFFQGDSFGFLDIAILPFSTWFFTCETMANFSIQAECPKLIAWVNKCNQIETVSKSLARPHKVYEVALQLKNKFGIL